MATYFTTTLGDAYERLIEENQLLRVTLVGSTSGDGERGTWITSDHKLEIKEAEQGERFGYQVVIFNQNDDCIITNDVEDLVRVYDSKIELCGQGDIIEPMRLSLVSGLKKKATRKK